MKMKKILVSFLGALAVAGVAKAEDFIVYQNGTVNSATTYHGWWEDSMNPEATDPTNSANKVISFKSSTGGAAASGGWLSANVGPFNTATISFDWYVTDNAKYIIDLTCDGTALGNQQYILDTAGKTGQWNTSTFQISTQFPNLAEAWKNDAGDKNSGYIFALEIQGGTEESVLYVNNVVYSNLETGWIAPDKDPVPAPTSVPVPSQNADEVLSIFSSSYPAATNFNIGNWGQATSASLESIDGADVYKLTNFNYLGWELSPTVNVSDYKYMHVDFWPLTQTNFGFTPISNLNGTKEKSIIMQQVNVQEWNSYDIPLSDWASSVDLEQIFQIKFDQGTGATCYIANVYFYGKKDGGDEPDTPVEPGESGATWYGTGSGSGSDGSEFVVNYKVVTNADQTFTVYADFDNLNNVGGLVPQFGAKGMAITNMSASTVEGYPYEGTSTGYQFTANENTELFFYLAYTGGAGRIDVTYLYGAENEPPIPLPVITAEAINITDNSAEIQYEVVLPDELAGATYSVTMDGTVVSASPIVLSDLSSKTTYTHELVVTATLGSETYESKPVEVKFTTLRAEGEEEPVFSSQILLTIPDCTLNGSSEKTTIETNISYSITYQDDRTLYIEMEPENQDVFNIIGLVAEVCVDGTYVDMSQTARANFFSATTTLSYEAQTTVPVFFFLKYAEGGPAQSDTVNYVTGSINTETGIANAEVEANENVDIFTLSGVKVRSNVKFNDIRNSLAPGLYIVGGKKVIVK